MQIPEYPRVIYAKAALEEVICQLRFPPILRATAEAPVVFQDAIRRRFPYLEERGPEFPQDLPPPVAKALREMGAPGPSERAFEFLTEDRDWKLSLTKDFLALSTEHYTRWERFFEHFEEPFQELCKEYEPSFFSRIGLRYRDAIVRSKLALDDVPWSELLQPHVAAELAKDDVERSVWEAQRTLGLDLGADVGRVRIRHFLRRKKQTDEVVYVIDADFFFEQKTEPANALQKLDELNKYAGRLFRWCISDRLYEAMGPESI